MTNSELTSDVRAFLDDYNEKVNAVVARGLTRVRRVSAFGTALRAIERLLGSTLDSRFDQFAGLKLTTRPTRLPTDVRLR